MGGPSGLLALPLHKYCKHQIVCPLSPPPRPCVVNKRSSRLQKVGWPYLWIKDCLPSWSSSSCLPLHLASFRSRSLAIVKHLEEARTHTVKDPNEKRATRSPEPSAASTRGCREKRKSELCFDPGTSRLTSLDLCFFILNS